ncbi:MAG: hypothetical protein ACJA1Z_002852 [Patiriisocius sp.]|jgi:hypothetical protein
MKTDEEIDIFKFLKEKLEQDFGTIPDSMVYTLRDICLAFPDFVAFFRQSGCNSIMAALALYFQQFEKENKKQYAFTVLKEKEVKSVLFYLLIGFTIIKAVTLFNKNKLDLDGPNL